MNTCDICKRIFRRKSAARDHKKQTGHCVCEHCRKALGTKDGLEQHINAVHHHKCPQCATTFRQKVLLKIHQRGKNHCYCGDCNKTFGSSTALTTHLQSSRHSTAFHCCDCDRDFQNSNALEQHLRHKVHKRPTLARPKPTPTRPLQHVPASAKTTQLPHSCAQCPRKFKSLSCLQQHLQSLAHKPLSNLRCIAVASCKKKFLSPSALLHHLESGACSSGMNSEKVKRIVVENDTENLVTKRQEPVYDMLHEVSKRLLFGSANQETVSDTESEVFVPTPSSSLSQACWTPEDGSVKDWAAAISQSSHRRCPFCSPDRRPFPTQQALQDHLLSAAHREPFVFCPVNLAVGNSGTSKAIRGFTTVSGLVQHIESGACVEGIAGFWKAAKYLENRLRTWGLNFTLTINSHENVFSK